jgi:transposase-like protein
VKGKDCYDLNCIDHVTKYITAHTLVEKRTKQACVSFLSQIKQTCYNQILTRYYCEKYRRIKDGKLITFVSDGFWNYRTAFNKLFYRIATLQFGVPIACKKYGLEHNNNPIERYNGKLKDRLKVIRGGFGSFEYAKAFMNLRHIIHNFVNPHQQLQGKTPAEKAEIKLSLGRMKLYNLIRYLANRLDDD